MRSSRSLLTLLLMALTGCGAVDTVHDRFEDAAGDLRHAAIRFARRLGEYIAEEGCELLRGRARWVVDLIETCEKQPSVEKTTATEKDSQTGSP